MTPTKDDALAALGILRKRANRLFTETLELEIEKAIMHRDNEVYYETVLAAITQPRETVSTTMDYDLIAPVAHYFNGDASKTKLWFETPNPNLGGVKPVDTPRDRLLKFITEQTLTQPPVDVEARKAEVWDGMNRDSALCTRHWEGMSAAIDYLVSKGCLK